MNAKELVEIVRNGAKPVIRVTDKYEQDGPDTGMLGRVIGVKKIDVWSRGESVAELIVDFKEFEEYNKSFAEHNWYDSDGNPTLTWMESKHYSDAGNFDLHIMYQENHKYSELREIEVVNDNNNWLNKYLQSNSNLSYVVWLEQQLDQLTK